MRKTQDEELEQLDLGTAKNTMNQSGEEESDDHSNHDH